MLVAGPLLGAGRLILLDFPSGPRFPQLDGFPLPSSGDLGNAAPLVAAHAALRSVDLGLAEKVLLLGPIVLGGVGMARLLRLGIGTSAPAALYGGTVFVLNPFTYDRYLSGHLYLLAAYAILPCLVSALLEPASTLERGVVFGVALAVLAVASVPLAGAFFLLATLLTLASAARLRDVLRTLVAAGLCGAGLAAYWLLPSLALELGYSVGGADLETYASRPQGLGVLPSLVSLRGFWRDEFPSPVAHPALNGALIVVLGLAALGAATLRPRSLALALGVAAALGVMLAAATAFEPGRRFVSALLEYARPLGAYREPQKLLALTSFAYAVLGAAGLDTLTARIGRRGLLAGCAIATVLAYSAGMFWAFGGRVSLSEYPQGWRSAESYLDSHGSGRVLVVPWRLYAVWGFSDGRITANPASSFFGRRVLVADVPEQSVDPFAGYVRELLSIRPARDLGRRLALLDVRYVLLLREADWWRYGFVRRTSDLRLVTQNPDLLLFENREWRGNTLPLQRIVVRTSPSVSESSRMLPVPRGLVVRRTIGPGAGAFVAVAERCTDGLRLAREEARCHDGAVAAFERPADDEPLWAAGDTFRVWGYGISLVFAVGVVLAWAVRRRRASER